MTIIEYNSLTDDQLRDYHREEAEWEMREWAWFPKATQRWGGFSWPQEVAGVATKDIEVT